MAITKNRTKEKYTIPFIGFGGVFYNLRKFMSILFVLFSVQCIYLMPNKETISNPFLEIFGNISSAYYYTTTTIANGTQTLSKWYTNINNLIIENVTLKFEVARLRATEEELALVRLENNLLKKQTKFVESVRYDTITARIGFTTHSLYGNNAIVHAGSNDGVQVGQVVMNADGILGRITSVSPHYSRLMLVTDFGSKISVVSSKSRTRVLLAGDNSGECKLLYAPKHSNLQVGELLLTSGDGKYYPPGLKVAIISDITDNAISAKTVAHSDSKVDFVNIIKYE